MNMKCSVLVLSVGFCLLSLAANAAVSLDYGTGENQVSYMNPTSHPNQEELHPYGPQSFRWAGGEFWVADSLAGRILRVSPEGKIVGKILVASTTYGLLEDISLRCDKDGKVQGVFVLAARTQEILEYSPDGRLVRTLGGAGEGNGTFGQLSGIQVGPAGHVVVADHANQTLTVFNPDGKMMREIHWEWSGFCLDKDGNLCYLHWDPDAQVTHLVVETIDGKNLRDVPLAIGEHTNPILWFLTSVGTPVITYVPGEGFAGKYKIAGFDDKGQPTRFSELVPPVAMNRFVEQADDGSLFIGVANYDTAPAGTFKIEPFELK